MKKWLLGLVIGEIIFFTLFILWLTTRSQGVKITGREQTSTSPTGSIQPEKNLIFVKQGILYTIQADGSGEKKLTLAGADIPYSTDNRQLGQTADGRFVTYVNLKAKSLTIIDLAQQKSRSVSSLATLQYFLSPIKSEAYYKKGDSLYRYDLTGNQESLVANIGLRNAVSISPFGDKLVLSLATPGEILYSYIDLNSSSLLHFDPTLTKGTLPPFFAQDANHYIVIKGRRIVLYRLSSQDSRELYYAQSGLIVQAALSPDNSSVYVLLDNGLGITDLQRFRLSDEKLYQTQKLDFPPLPPGQSRAFQSLSFLAPNVLLISTSVISIPKNTGEFWGYNLTQKKLTKIL